MSNAWEVTDDDVQLVLQRHHVRLDDSSPKFAAIVDAVTAEGARVQEAALRYTGIDEQTESAQDEIENILIEGMHVDGPKRFTAP